MQRAGVQCRTMWPSAASTSCRMKALLSTALCSSTLAVASTCGSMARCRRQYRTPSVHTATRDTPERRFFT